MRSPKVVGLTFITLTAVTTALVFQNCAGGSTAVPTVSNSEAAATIFEASAPAINYPNQQSSTIVLSGGNSPFHFMVHSGPCSVDFNSGVIQSDGTAGICYVTVYDGTGQTTLAAIPIVVQSTTLRWVQTASDVTPANMSEGTAYLSYDLTCLQNGFSPGGPCATASSICTNAASYSGTNIATFNVYACQ